MAKTCSLVPSSVCRTLAVCDDDMLLRQVPPVRARQQHWPVLPALSASQFSGSEIVPRSWSRLSASSILSCAIEVGLLLLFSLFFFLFSFSFFFFFFFLSCARKVVFVFVVVVFLAD